MKELQQVRKTDDELLDTTIGLYKSAICGRVHNRRSVLKAVIHQLEDGEASEGNLDDIRWCAMQLKDLLEVEL